MILEIHLISRELLQSSVEIFYTSIFSRQLSHLYVSDEEIIAAPNPSRPEELRTPHKRFDRINDINRIAGLSQLLREGHKLEPIDLEFDNYCCSIIDGHHRFRAYEFLDMDIIRARCGGYIHVFERCSVGIDTSNET